MGNTWNTIIIGSGLSAAPLALRLTEAGQSVLIIQRSEATETELKTLFRSTPGEAPVKLPALKKTESDLSNSQLKNPRSSSDEVFERIPAEELKSWPVSSEILNHYYTEAETLLSVIEGHGKSVIETCLDPALSSGRLEIFTECEVLELKATQNKVTGVEVKHCGKTRLLTADHVILAEDAVNTPLLLMTSRSPQHPQGVGNWNGLAGRFLMRRLTDFYAVKNNSQWSAETWELLKFENSGPDRAFDLNLAPEMWADGQQMPDRKLLAQLSPKGVKSFVRRFFSWTSKNRTLLKTTVADQPQFGNRIWRANGKTLIQYQISAEGLEKVRSMRSHFQSLFSQFSAWFLPAAEKNQWLQEACGTCRMGLSPSDSVVDENNRVHGIQNLYVTDSSFFPTCPRQSPALTLAANSLRVSDLILGKSFNKKHLRSVPKEDSRKVLSSLGKSSGSSSDH